MQIELSSKREKEKIRYNLSKAFEEYFKESLKNTLWCGLSNMQDISSTNYESPVIETDCIGNLVYYTFTYKGISNSMLKDHSHDFDEAHLKILNTLKEEAFKRFSKDFLCRVANVNWFRHGTGVQVHIGLKPATRYSDMHYKKLINKILGLEEQYPENTFLNK